MVWIVALFMVLLSGCSSKGLKGIGERFPEKFIDNFRGVRPATRMFSLLWTRNTDSIYNTGNLPIALNSPLMRKGVLYVGDGRGVMGAYNAIDGRPLWRKEDGGDYHSGLVNFQESLIYGNSDGRIFARREQTGELLYSVDVGATVEGHPTLYKGRAFFHLRDHKILCLDAKTGKILWAWRKSVPQVTTIQGVSSPVVFKNRLYAGFADGTVAALSIEEGILQWEKKIARGSKFIDIDMTPVFYRGKMFIGESGDLLNVINPRNGGILRRLKYSVSATPVHYKGRLLLGTSEGELVLLGANLKEFKRIKVSNSPIGSIVPWKGLIAVAADSGQIHLVDVKWDAQGPANIRETFPLGHAVSAVFGRPVTDEGKLALLSSRNRLYVFR